MSIEPDDENWLRFFEQYKRLPVLWDVNDEGYKIHDIRERAWAILLDAYKKIDRNATVEKLKYKVHNFRCAYRRELQKIQRTEWEDPDAAPVSQLWYFEYLDFLRKQPNLPTDVPVTDLVQKEDSDYERRSKRMRIDSSQDDDDSRYDCSSPIKFSRQWLNDFEEDKDEADIYGEGWAVCFRKLTEEQQIYAKKVIDEILLLGQLEKLTIDTTVSPSEHISSELVFPYSSIMLTSQPPSEESLSLQDENILYENHDYAKKEFYSLNGE